MYDKVNLLRHAKPKRGSVLTKECQHRQCHQGMWGTLVTKITYLKAFNNYNA